LSGLLATSSTQVLLNRIPGESITFRRGLRQRRRKLASFNLYHHAPFSIACPYMQMMPFSSCSWQQVTLISLLTYFKSLVRPQDSKPTFKRAVHCLYNALLRSLRVQQHLTCRLEDFPMKYLGFPVTKNPHQGAATTFY
jgi:hypothetical protein